MILHGRFIQARYPGEIPNHGVQERSPITVSRIDTQSWYPVAVYVIIPGSPVTVSLYQGDHRLAAVVQMFMQINSLIDRCSAEPRSRDPMYTGHVA